MRAVIKRVRISNYRSIEHADVELHDLTFLVGPNGSGKSNFLDALKFVSELQCDRLDEVLRRRGGPFVWFVSPEGTLSEKLEIHLELVTGESDCTYRLQVSRGADGEASITDESWTLGSGTARRDARSRADESALRMVALIKPRFEPLYAALAGIAVYAPEPSQMRLPHPIGSGRMLESSATNAADVMWRLKAEAPQDYDRVLEYMQALDFIVSVVPGSEAPVRHLLFKRPDDSKPWFSRDQVSDGMLRFFAVLLAAFQSEIASPRLTLLGMEEPENYLHPGAAGLLFDALSEASQRVQVIVSTHSADLLNIKDLTSESILAFASRNGRTVLGPLSEATRNIVRERLYTVGELLRANAIEPVPS
ncbi:MAG: AAA family ATPase [Bryobacteraceae bacterium]|nr:AAA family ATPase [Bryobacteraceae bacterium]